MAAEEDLVRPLKMLYHRWRPTKVPVGGSLEPSAPMPARPAVTGSGFAVVDVETTGLVAARDHVVEIAVIDTDDSGRIINEWATLLNPGCSVGATHIHGITAADVRRAPRFQDVAGEVTARLAGRALVAHNARFDLAFLQAEYARIGLIMPACPYLCTLEASWTYLPYLSRRRLADCCWACGIQLGGAHSALNDARATAALVASYLHPSRPPRRDHLQLLLHAARVAWPPLPRTAVAVAMRNPAGRPQAEPAAQGALAALLDDLPLSSVVEQGAPTSTTAYVELLAEALEDGVLTDAEISSLAEVAKMYALTRKQVDAAHRGFLLAMAHKAIEDGKVTRVERHDLLAATAALGFPDRIVKEVLDAAHAALSEERARNCRPLPEPWQYGEPLRIGQRVVFTGCDNLERARLEGRAQAAGLLVTGWVSPKTAILITDGANPDTEKAIAARGLGTRTVTPAQFAGMVAHVQPAAMPVDTTGAPRANVTRNIQKTATAAAKSTSSLSTVTPGAIRSWARQQGLPVGERGRLPAELIEAYRTHHVSVSQ